MNNQANTPNSQPTTTTFPFTPEPLGPVPAPSPHQVGGIPVPPLSAAGGSKARGQKGGTVFDVVTDRIISLMEQGTAPWRASWVSTAGKPISLSTGKPYRGINHFLLSMIAQLTGYTSPYWLTFNQVSERGGKVRKGEKGSPCFFWKVYEGAPGRGCPCSEAGIAPPVIENQAAYLAGWLKVLKADKRAIVVAAAKAEKAADYILGHKEVPVTGE